MILILGGRRATEQYASERNLLPSEIIRVSHDVQAHTRGRTVAEIIVVEGWLEALNRNDAAYLRALVADGAKWISGVNS